MPQPTKDTNVCSDCTMLPPFRDLPKPKQRFTSARCHRPPLSSPYRAFENWMHEPQSRCCNLFCHITSQRCRHDGGIAWAWYLHLGRHITVLHCKKDAQATSSPTLRDPGRQTAAPASACPRLRLRLTARTCATLLCRLHVRGLLGENMSQLADQVQTRTRSSRHAAVALLSTNPLNVSDNACHSANWAAEDFVDSLC